MYIINLIFRNGTVATICTETTCTTNRGERETTGQSRDRSKGVLPPLIFLELSEILVEEALKLKFLKGCITPYFIVELQIFQVILAQCVRFGVLLLAKLACCILLEVCTKAGGDLFFNLFLLFNSELNFCKIRSPF